MIASSVSADRLTGGARDGTCAGLARESHHARGYVLASEVCVHSRRTVLLGAASTGAVLSMPGFLAACGPKTPLSIGSVVVPEDPFLAWFGIDRPLLGRVLAALGSRGADHGEIYLQHARSSRLSLDDGIVSRAHIGIEQGAGLRVVIGDQVGYAYTEDLSEEALVAAAHVAAAIAAGTTPVAPVAFTGRAMGDRYRIAVPWSEVGVDDKLALVRKVEATTRSKDLSLHKISVSLQDSDEKVLIADLQGNIVVDDRPMSRLWVNVTAKRGEAVQANGSNLAGRHGLDWYTDARLDQVAGEAVDRTLISFDAVRPKAGEWPVVLAAGASGILLHEAIGHGMEADFNRKGTSIYSTMIGQNVAPDFVTIVDDGTQSGERGALNVDDEGHEAGRTVLVENGVLRTYLHDRISGRHYGLASTGSGRRESYRHPPMPRMRSTYMENGPHTVDEIVAAVPYGIIAETYTNGQVQIGAGDYTFFVKNGWLVENGKKTVPIKDVNIIGNGPETLRRMSMVAADGKLDSGGWTCGKDGQSVPVSQGMPTVLVDKLVVGGGDV